MSMTDIDSENSKLGCFETASRKLKRNRSEMEMNDEKPAAKSIFVSIGEKLGFLRTSDSQKPKSILTNHNHNRSSGELNYSFAHDSIHGHYDHPFNCTNTVEESEIPPKKRVKFDEENVVCSSITYQRQSEHANRMLIPPTPTKHKDESFITKFINFTASLF